MVFELVFVLTFENAFSQSFQFKANRKSKFLLKNGTRDFQNSLAFQRSACLYVTISESFKRFQYFNFETNFLENEALFQKNWSTAFQLKPLFFCCVFFLSGFSYTDTDDSQDSRGREGTILYSTLPLPPAHKHSDIYLQLCM